MGTIRNIEGYILQGPFAGSPKGEAWRGKLSK